MALHTISDQQPEFGVLKTLLPEPLRIAALKLIATGERSSASIAQVDKRVLRVPDEKPEPLFTFSIADAIPVVSALLAHKPADESIEISTVENDEHIIDEINGIEQHFILRIARAIWILSLN